MATLAAACWVLPLSMPECVSSLRPGAVAMAALRGFATRREAGKGWQFRQELYIGFGINIHENTIAVWKLKHKK